MRVREVLLEYVADPRNRIHSENERYGPDMYLEAMTWPEAGYDDHAIRGPLPELARLAELIETKMTVALRGQSIAIRNEFAPNSPCSLVLDLREDGFDPANG